MRCDQCSQPLQESEGYAFYSDAKLLGRLETGNMLMCEKCTDRIMSAESFARSDESIVGWIFNPDDVKEMNARSILNKCRRIGLTPAQAKAKARELAMRFLDDPDRGPVAVLEYWVTSDPSIDAPKVLHVDRAGNGTWEPLAPITLVVQGIGGERIDRASASAMMEQIIGGFSSISEFEYLFESNPDDVDACRRVWELGQKRNMTPLLFPGEWMGHQVAIGLVIPLYNSGPSKALLIGNEERPAIRRQFTVRAVRPANDVVAASTKKWWQLWK